MHNARDGSTPGCTIRDAPLRLAIPVYRSGSAAGTSACGWIACPCSAPDRARHARRDKEGKLVGLKGWERAVLGHVSARPEDLHVHEGWTLGHSRTSWWTRRWATDGDWEPHVQYSV